MITDQSCTQTWTQKKSFRKTLRSGLVIALVSFGLVACNEQSTTEMDNPPEMPATDATTSPEASAATNNVPEEVTCATCGIVSSITVVTTEGQGTGVGAAIGAIAGGLAGNQVGGGSGKKVATAAGVIGGAVAGNAIEKNRRTGVSYEVVIAMDGGGERIIAVPDTTGIVVGSKVTVQGTDIFLR